MVIPFNKNQNLCVFFLMTGFKLKTFLVIKVDLFFFLFQVQNCDFFAIIHSMILSLSIILLDFIEDLSCNKSKNVWCNVLRLDDIHASLPGLKYRSPLFDALLFAIRNLPCFSVPAHLCASHPFNCKCSAYRRLSLMTTTLIVYKAWLCP
jgi:hypothetical protein